jgi:hypothetical protein
MNTPVPSMLKMNPLLICNRWAPNVLCVSVLMALMSSAMAATPNDAPSGPRHWSVKDASPVYDFEITQPVCNAQPASAAARSNAHALADDQAHTESPDDAKECMTTVVVTDKHGQVIDTLKSPAFEGPDNADPSLLVNAWKDGSPPSIVAKDFNFDGSVDLAISNGNDGPYGGPTYDVYVFNRTRHHFVESAELTELANESLGLFQVDEKNKTLTTFSKDGCCWHQETTYKVAPRRGLYIVARKTEAVTSDGERVDVTTETLQHGKLVPKVQSYPIKTYYGP